MTDWTQYGITKFHSDTKQRKQFFSGLSFSHPAKMHLSLQLWLIDNFTKEGETILDPMAGSGTILIACSLGRHVIAVDLEQKFVDMMKGNWEKIQQRGCQLGYSMGTAQIVQGDARNLTGILVDKIITSPPYAEAVIGGPGGIDWSKGTRGKAEGNKPRDRSKEPAYKHLPGMALDWGYSRDPSNIGNLPYGSIDAVISSPPYENQIHKGTGEWSQSLGGKLLGGEESAGGKMLGVPQGEDYIKSQDNIGNLKSDSYLQAMLQVYQQCHAVLKDGGLMVLVTKNFIRNKKQVDLAADTIRLCEQARFHFHDRWYRELASQSFWRIIYHQKYPDVEPIKYEDILVFRKG